VPWTGNVAPEFFNVKTPVIRGRGRIKIKKEINGYVTFRKFPSMWGEKKEKDKKSRGREGPTLNTVNQDVAEGSKRR